MIWRSKTDKLHEARIASLEARLAIVEAAQAAHEIAPAADASRTDIRALVKQYVNEVLPIAVDAVMRKLQR